MKFHIEYASTFGDKKNQSPKYVEINTLNDLKQLSINEMLLYCKENPSDHDDEENNIRLLVDFARQIITVNDDYLDGV